MRTVLLRASALGLLFMFVVACSDGDEGGAGEALLDPAPQGTSGEVGQPGSAGHGSRAEPCPTDFAQANYQPCAFNCQVCRPAESDPCWIDGEMLSCVDGTWRYSPGHTNPSCDVNASERPR